MDKYIAAELFATKLGQHPKRLVCLSVAILTVGFFWHLIAVVINPFSETIAFPRSGSLLVVLAIVAVFFNHLLITAKRNRQLRVDVFSTPEDQLSKAMAQVLSKKIAKEVGQDNWDRYLLERPNGIENEVVGRYSDFQNIVVKDKAIIENLNTAAINITYTEAVAGIVGTLIWGFGDLLFDIPILSIWNWIAMN